MNKTTPPKSEPQQPAQTKALALVDEVKGSLAKMGDQFKLALPPHIPVERFVRVVQTAVTTSPDLVAADRTSLFAAAMKAAQEGLLPDGKEAAIVVYNVNIGNKANPKWIKKAQFMPMVAGILKKVRNSGELAMITSNVIYKSDQFKYWVDQEGEHIHHEPNLFGDRGERIGVYSFARTKDGAVYIDVMRKEEVEAARNVSRAKDSGPWSGPFENEMWKKTSIKRLSKRLPMSTDLEMTVKSDDELFTPPEPTTEDEPPKEPKKKSSRLHQSMGIEQPAAPTEHEIKDVSEQNTEGESTGVSEEDVPI